METGKVVCTHRECGGPGAVRYDLETGAICADCGRTLRGYPVGPRSGVGTPPELYSTYQEAKAQADRQGGGPITPSWDDNPPTARAPRP